MRTSDRHDLLRRRSFGICRQAKLGKVRHTLHARAKKLSRAAEYLVYSLTPSGVLAENNPKNRVSSAFLRGQKCLERGQKCLKRGFSRRSPVGEWSRGARSMPRVFGRGSRSQPAVLVSERDDAALFRRSGSSRIRFCKIR